jgi:hypothetical protein
MIENEFWGLPPEPPEETDEDPVYIATGSFLYRFSDGDYLRLTEGRVVVIEEPRLSELLAHGYVKEVTLDG